MTCLVLASDPFLTFLKYVNNFFNGLDSLCVAAIIVISVIACAIEGFRKMFKK